MKCPTCNAWTNVLESRPIKDGVKRRRECANLHRFTTYETEFNHERNDVFTGRRVLNWMRRLLTGETNDVVQPRQGDLFESEGKQNKTGEEVLNNIFKSLDERKRDERS